jgi:RNA polymerase sigma-70 factor (ECF subfamily)
LEEEPVVYDASKLTCYLAHRDSLVSYAARIVGSRAWAEDIVQEAYLRFAAVDAREQDPGSGPTPIQRPLGYLRRIVHNLALDWANHLYPERRPSPEHGASEIEPQPAPDASTPEHEMMRHEALCVIADALTELPQRTRKAFELHAIEDRTLNEVRRELGISTTLAHELVRRARSHCAMRLASA